ncbi:hypothetical protein D7W82_05160 [Corallococcus sp. CA049B]|uniref:transketolase family protein n=1 Tax=Corallococcus sp. CA049B TaxID=2316730 RepID=UPI000EA11167|nr:transketolase C-terminal domain-containing protein [Corallococcus sp. CA049B]RKG89981.1 hypothetical protein D7W82_05160 [Corallococcus sp. CA049B]
MSASLAPAVDLAHSPEAWLAAHPELSSRLVFRHAAARFAQEDARVVFLEADLGGGGDPFEKRHPQRYFNLGICEATMLDMACGLAHGGHTVIAHSFAAFGVMRACEQVRLNLAYARANVKLVCDYGGVAGAFFGPTHHAIEDLAVLRAMPNLTVVSPADGLETVQATRAMLQHDGPVYLRLGRNRVTRLDIPRPPFELGRAALLREGDDVGLLAHGEVGVSVALDAAKLLEAQGVSARVLNVHTLKPLDEEAVRETAARTRLLVTVEEHNVLGGLGSAVCETVCSLDLQRRVLRVGLQDRYDSRAGSHEALLQGHGLEGGQVAERILGVLPRTPVFAVESATRRD